MAVPKVAVIALVAIIAIPILLGYAMNLTEVTESDYKGSGDSVIVSDLLMNGMDYTTAHGNIYQLNTNFMMGGIKSLPLYENHTSANTNLYSRILSVAAMDSTDYDLWDYYNWGINVMDSTSTTYLRMSIYKVSGGTETSYGYQNNIINASYDAQTNTLYYSYIVYSGLYTFVNTSSFTDDHIRLKFTYYGGFDPSDNVTMWGASVNDDPSLYSGYVDFAAGFRILDHKQAVNQPYIWTEWPAGSVIFPTDTKTALITIDLDSITDSNYSVRFGSPGYYLNKTTTAGTVSWQIVDYYDPTYTIDLYYNQSGGNTYQIYMYTDNDRTPSGTPGYYNYTRHVEYRYVGDWPDLIGEANYYLKFDYTYTSLDDEYPNFGGFAVEASITPIMRVDDAEYKALSYQVIKNEEYDPSVFRTNPTTTISNINKFGSSLSFGGNTYTVSNEGKITISGHEIPVNNLTLSSVPNSSGTYDNKIGNTIISTTATPSKITFGGSWLATISTQSLESYTYTKTEWIAGSFAWDGMDQNFLMAGLITSLGVFIALGIYGRRSGARVLPLMLVCGGAALLFFIMI